MRSPGGDARACETWRENLDGLQNDATSWSTVGTLSRRYQDAWAGPRGGRGLREPVAVRLPIASATRHFPSRANLRGAA